MIDDEPIIEQKKCTKCGEYKPLDKFPKDKKRKDGHYVVCLDCRHKGVEITIQLTEKQCKKCLIIKPVSEFNTSKYSKDGYAGVCKICRHKPRLIHTHVEEKICTKCHIKKPISEFNNEKQNKDGHYSICKDCIRVCKQEYNKRVATDNSDDKILEIERTQLTKKCMQCGLVKPISEFNVRRTSTDGHDIYCIACHNDGNKAYFHNHKNLSDEEYKEWRDKKNEQSRQETAKVEREVFAHYCKDGIIKCADPFGDHKSEVYDNIDGLTLDHINGDGYLEKTSDGKRPGGRAYYRKIKNAGYPPKFQVLCGACQLVKAKVNREFFNGKKKYDKTQSAQSGKSAKTVNG